MLDELPFSWLWSTTEVDVSSLPSPLLEKAQTLSSDPAMSLGSPAMTVRTTYMCMSIDEYLSQQHKTI